MTRQRGRVFAVTLLAAFFTSLSVRAQTNTPPSGVTVADDATGRTVHLRNGQTLAVRLAANATTGYHWSVQSGTGRCLELTSNTYLESRSSALGRGGTAVFVFTARRAGSTALKLGYSRPFEPHVPPVRAYVLMVVVQGG
ncbi:MAG TPA: protease inhibitor I42 family protein [Chthoniobacterales bacterium]